MVKKLDYINIVLMLFSAFLAIQLPFKLFLFAYAVLGPLHYLTEIGWLHKRNYFTENSIQWKWLWGVAIIMGLGMALRYSFYWEYSKEFMTRFANPDKGVLHDLLDFTKHLIYMALIIALLAVLCPKMWQKISVGLISVFVFYVIKDMPFYQSLFVILVPTIIHVSLFTWIFMLNGAIKNKSKAGYISAGMFVLFVTLFFVVDINWIQITANESAFEIIKNGGFFYANIELLKLINQPANIFTSEIGIRVQCFIAFAYTYHYLNWFSKTGVIQWHKVSKRWLIVTLVIWVASVSLYYYDYVLGIVVLFMLSIAHVMLEFPLNIRSFVELKNSIFKK